MSKYDEDFKYRIVQEYLSGRNGITALARKYGVKSKDNVSKWIRQFENFGIDGLKQRKSKQIYTMNFKLDVLNYYYQSGLGMKDVAIKFNLPDPGMISTWKKQVDTVGINALKPKKKGRTAMTKQTSNSSKKKKKELTREQQLERENELLKAELAFIKKLRALGQDIPDRLKNETPESFTHSEKDSN